MFQRKELPFVFMNGAVSADGKLALENRSLIQFSSKRDRRFVFQLRASAHAVLCGAETVETFSIDLAAGPAQCRATRKRRGLPAEPLRVLVSHDGQLDPRARIFQKRVSPIIVLTTRRLLRRCEAALSGVAQVRAFGQRTIDFPAAFRWLRDEHGVKRLLCEGGGETNAALIRAGVVDEIHITLCPLVLCGGHAPTLCDGDGVKSLGQAPRLRLKAAKKIGGELFITYAILPRRKRKSS